MKQNNPSHQAEENLYSGPSKSQLKREMLALQDLAKELLNLNPKQLANLELADDLALALTEHQRIKSHEAQRRHLRRLAKLIFAHDPDEISAKLEIYDSSSQTHNQHFQQLENWREQLLTQPEFLSEFIDLHPNTDVQHLRQLIRNTQQEIAQNKPPATSKKLFSYLRKLTGY